MGAGGQVRKGRWGCVHQMESNARTKKTTGSRQQKTSKCTDAFFFKEEAGSARSSSLLSVYLDHERHEQFSCFSRACRIFFFFSSEERARPIFHIHSSCNTIVQPPSFSEHSLFVEAIVFSTAKQKQIELSCQSFIVAAR